MIHKKYDEGVKHADISSGKETRWEDFLPILVRREGLEKI